MAPAVRQPDEDTRGIVDPVEHRASVDHARHEPSAATKRFVAWYWAIEWDLGDAVHSAEVLVHPVVNLTFEPDQVLGAMFRPAGFRPLVDTPLKALVDRVLPAVEVLGPGTTDLHDRVRAAADGADRARVVDEHLATLLPGHREHQASEDTTAIVERIAADRSLLRVDQVAEAFDTSVRQLQRRFADHVGVSPKWVIQRYRLYDAAEAAAAGDDVDWATLAADLGYSDQAHLVRSFTRAIGTPPDTYARSLRPDDGSDHGSDDGGDAVNPRERD